MYRNIKRRLDSIPVYKLSLYSGSSGVVITTWYLVSGSRVVQPIPSPTVRSFNASPPRVISSGQTELLRGTDAVPSRCLFPPFLPSHVPKRFKLHTERHSHFGYFGDFGDFGPFWSFLSFLTN